MFVCVKMPINKFGFSLHKSEVGSSTMNYYTLNGLLRNYVRDNALCRSIDDFDAKTRKIRRVAQPEADSDAVNKQYVDQVVKSSIDQHVEEFVKKQSRWIEQESHALRKRITALEYHLQDIQLVTQSMKEYLEVVRVSHDTSEARGNAT